MKLFTDNPRKISASEIERLKGSMLKYGDLSGITHILDTDEIIAGNQRSTIGGESHTGSLFELCWSKTEHKREIIKVPYFRFYGMDTQKRLHPTQKPEKLFSWFIDKFTKPVQVVLDFYASSGTTLVSCQRLSRRGRAIEKLPKYCAITLERMAITFPELQIKKIK